MGPSRGASGTVRPVQFHTHFFLGWLLPWRALDSRRDRVIVTLAGVAPDIDGIALLGGKEAFAKYHHVYTHHLAGALLAAAAGFAWGRRRWATAGFAAGAWLLHLFCDLVGAGERYEDGTYAYPLPLLFPFSSRPFDPFPWSWNLASWQNLLVMAAALLLAGRMALREGRTPVEVLSLRADRTVVAVLRKWCGVVPPG